MTTPQQTLERAYAALSAAAFAHPSAAVIAAHTAKVLEDVEPVATVADVYQSRYTIEWNGGNLPEGAKLYSADTVAALKSRADALAARVAEMEKDAGRLDWAEENSAAWIKGYGQMYFGHTMANRGTIYANSFRAAIDAAALAAKGQA